MYLNEEFTIPVRDVRYRNSYIGTLEENLIDQLSYEDSFCVTLHLQYINKILQDAAVCRYLFTAKLLYMFQMSIAPSSGAHQTVTAASGTGHSVRATTFYQRGLIKPRWQKVVALTL